MLCSMCGQPVSEAEMVVDTIHGYCHEYCLYDDHLLDVPASHLKGKTVAAALYADADPYKP